MRKILPIFLLLLICTVSIAQIQQKPIPGTPLKHGNLMTGGLVSCWVFNEGNGDKVFDSVQLTTGTVTCTTPWGIGPIIDHYIDFDGDNDYVSLQKPDVGTDFSIAMWAYAVGDAAYNGNDGYYACDNADVTNFLVRRTSGGNDQISFEIGEDTVSGVSSSVTKWCFYVITHGKAGTEVYLYEDGLVIASDTAFASNFNGFTSDIYLGNRQALDRDLDGHIASFMIYNRVLTPTEVRLLYSNTFCMYDAPLDISIMYGALGAGGSSVPVLMYHYQNH